MHGKRQDSRQKQSTIASFFKRPIPNKENIILERASAKELTGNAAATPSVKPTISKDDPRPRPPTAKAPWWTTPPKSGGDLPGSRKRSAEPVPPFSLQPAKRMSSGGSAPWEGKVRPLVRPNGMASASRITSQPSIVRAMLSDEQKEVLRLIVDQGESVFFTGAAGTGKSHLLREVVSALRRGRYHSEVAVTATTGLAAFNVGGKTVHRWAGIGLGEASAAMLAQKVKKNGEARENWRRCRVLVIDEVSMLNADLLDKLEELARLVRNKSEPFGGLQVILTGDFFQLPPVSRGSQGGKLCFEAKCWPVVIKHNVVLTRVFRQKDDRLVRMLNAMRRGKLTPEIVSSFEGLDREVRYDDGLEPTQLYPLRHQVDQANASRMRALHGSVFVYEARDSSLFDSTQKLFEQLLAPQRLELKVGAQVLLIRNLNDQLVNGRRGQVVTFMNEQEWTLLGPFMRENARAMSLYNATIDLANADKKTPEEDAVLEAELAEIEFPDDGTRGMYLKALRSPLRTKLPVVDFRQGQIVLIDRVEFSTDSGGPQRNEATREQLPLVPSWALSIHKAQGQTLDRVIVDLSRVFEAGQAYVAVSRATSYDRLQIKGFRRENVKVHPKVVEFYDKIEPARTFESS